MTARKVSEAAYIPALIHIDAKGRRRTVDIVEASKDEQEAFYRSLLQIAPGVIRRAIMRELGLSSREQRRRTTDSIAGGLWLAVETRKAEMRRNGARPRTGIHEAAIAEIASEHDITPAALKKRFQRRLTLTANQRRYLKRPLSLSLPFVVGMVAECQELAHLRRLQRAGES